MASSHGQDEKDKKSGVAAASDSKEVSAPSMVYVTSSIDDLLHQLIDEKLPEARRNEVFDELINRIIDTGGNHFLNASYQEFSLFLRGATVGKNATAKSIKWEICFTVEDNMDDIVDFIHKFDKDKLATYTEWHLLAFIIAKLLSYGERLFSYAYGKDFSIIEKCLAVLKKR